jgi:4-hydroxybenzoate polyprenyltransferase
MAFGICCSNLNSVISWLYSFGILFNLIIDTNTNNIDTKQNIYANGKKKIISFAANKIIAIKTIHNILVAYLLLQPETAHNKAEINNNKIIPANPLPRKRVAIVVSTPIKSKLISCIF